MAELVLLIIALVSLFSSVELGAFFFTIAVAVLAWKRHSLAEDFGEMRKLQMEQNDALHCELTALQRTTDGLRKDFDQSRADAVAVPVHTSQVSADASKPQPVSDLPKHAATTVPSWLADARTAEPQAALPVRPQPAVEPVAPPVATAPKPAQPVRAAAPVAPPPSPPPAFSPVTVAQLMAQRSAASHLPAPTPRRSLADRVKSALALEEVLGTNWLNKIGVIILVMGVALFGIYELGELGPAGKVSVLLAVGLAMLGGGVVLERKERYQLLGKTAIGGGWALAFFTSYAMHHVHAMQIIRSESLDLALMLIVAIAMALHTLRYRSQLVTGLAFLLAYSTIALSHDTVYALSAGAILAVGIVVIALKMRWYELEVFGILSSYLNHFYWLWKLLGPQGANHKIFPEFYASAGILLLYWLVYRVSYVIRRGTTEDDEKISSIAAILNVVALLGVMKFQSARPEMAFFALLALGALELAFGQLPMTRKRRPAFVLLSIVGIVLMIAAVPFRYSGGNVSVLWLLGAELLLAAGIVLKEVLFRRMGLLSGLLVGVHVLGIDSVQLFHAREASQSPLIWASVLMFTCAIAYYANAKVISRKWKLVAANELDERLLLVHSYLGAVVAALACWAVAPNDWTALAWALLLVALSAGSSYLDDADLLIQASLFGAIVTARTIVVNLRLGEPQGPHVSLRYLLVPVIAAALYVAAALIGRISEDALMIVRHVLAWSGTALLALLVWTEVPAAWIPIAWLMLGVALALIGTRWKLTQLIYQQNALAVAAVVRLVAYNYDLTATHGPLTLRLITVVISAAILYGISRWAISSRIESGRIVAYLHTWAATGLLAGLAWFELPNAWLAVVWIVFALALAIVGRVFSIKELPWQTHVLSLIAVARALTVNVHSTELYHGITARLATLVVVAAVLYVLTRVVPMDDDWRKQHLHHAYSAAASVLIALLMWYELQPLAVAVAWGLFGVVLSEAGLLRKVWPLRMQGYIALTAAFARIFFVNLSTGAVSGEWFGPRMTTVAPLALMFFFVYWQAGESEAPDQRESGIHIDTLMAFIASITVAALLYFQVPGGWIATAWSVMVVALLAAALLFSREVFLQQAMLLSLATLSRGIIHNLYGSSYFTDAGWRGRYFELGSAVLVLAAGLALAFPLRRKYPTVSDHGKLRRLLSAATSRPEQVLFFVAILLMTMMLALKMRAGMVTVAWGIEALIVILLALSLGERSYRLTGMGLLLLCVGKIMLVDAWQLAARDRYITFIVLGLAILAVSYLYTRYRETVRQYL